MSAFPWNHLGSCSGVPNGPVRLPFWSHWDNGPFLRPSPGCHRWAVMWKHQTPALTEHPLWPKAPLYKSISTTGQLTRSRRQSCQSDAPWAALEEAVPLSASKVVREDPLTTADGAETASDRRTNTGLAVGRQPSLCFICPPFFFGFAVRPQGWVCDIPTYFLDNKAHLKFYNFLKERQCAL